jgi:glycosyltransferase involved in cell wall biosynthesis
MAAGPCPDRDPSPAFVVSASTAEHDADPFLHEYFRRFRSTIREPDEQRSLLFLVHSTGISGGSYVILQHAQYLAQRGWRVGLAVRKSEHGFTPWHPALESLAVMSIDEAAEHEFDIVLATFWPTVYELPRLRGRHFMYLVQSVESRFYGDDPVNEDWAPPLAELTYSFGLPIVTIATWLQVYLAMRHKTPSFLVRNGIRKDVYVPFGPAVEPRVEGRLRVLVEGPTNVTMKNVQTAARLAREGGADEVWLMTGGGGPELSSVDRSFLAVPIESTPVIYRSCDVLLKLSKVEGMFGPPLEMFHCGGTAITYDVSGSEEYLVSGENSLVLPMHDEAAVADAVRALKASPEFLRKLRAGALGTAAEWPDWQSSSREFERVVAAVSRQPSPCHAEMMLAIKGASFEMR